MNAETMQATRWQELGGRFDRVILLASCALGALGLVMVGSSSMAIAEGLEVGPFHFLVRHVIFLVLGLGLALWMSRIELRNLERFSHVCLLAGLTLLLAVFLPGIGHTVNGARRWINLVVSNFQAVEAVKLLLVVWLASYIARHRERIQTTMLAASKPFLVVSIFVLALLAQPDFGSATLLLAITAGMIWLAGVRLLHVAIPTLLAVPVLVWAALAEPYRVRRLTSFLDPWQDPFNSGFQLTQALIAIGRGEWFGVGLGGSVQKLFYLPEAHTDFIFAVIAEELGFVDIVGVLACFSVLVGRAFWLGLRGVELGRYFAGFVAFGIALWIGLQAFVSISVNLGLLPTKGLTLPLVSSGGSSVLMTCAALGLLLRVSYELDRSERQVAWHRGELAEPEALDEEEPEAMAPPVRRPSLKGRLRIEPVLGEVA